MNRDNQPTYNVNRNIINFKDFNVEDEKEELLKIKRGTTSNSDRQQIIGNPKYKFNKITRKMDEITPDMVDDDLDSFEESRLYESNIQMDITIKIPEVVIQICRNKGISDNYIHEVYENYINHITGIDYNNEKEMFELYCDVDDNICDYKN